MFLAKENGYFEIIIYVIAMVVGLAANAYRNYTKRKEREAQPQREEEPVFPEVLFDPVIEYAEPESPEYEIEESLAEEEEPVLEESIPEEFLAEKQEDIKMSIEGLEVFHDTAEQIEEFSFETETNSIAEESKTIYNISLPGEKLYGLEEETDFDLEQAIIYSEILNPKYINKGY